ncbi:YdeI/OmpD-associated family protein [Candidatus Saccharibacteria bacterium]|nr:YdeI/OmpD-associated family protein [Candidatus Saccharibacteria bacterium]
MRLHRLPAGTVHASLPKDLLRELSKDTAAQAAWIDITPLARNEWICWVETAKLIETRKRRVIRTRTELAEGIRRPCCWPGCMHREKNGK